MVFHLSCQICIFAWSQPLHPFTHWGSHQYHLLSRQLFSRRELKGSSSNYLLPDRCDIHIWVSTVLCNRPTSGKCPRLWQGVEFTVRARQATESINEMALRGIKVLELAGLAPAPFCGMILADFGADVIRVDRAGSRGLDVDRMARGKRSISIDLKQDRGRALVRKIADRSDVLIDPFRPGVLEGMGLGPGELHKTNPGLVVARITGYGQSGPLSKVAGHDINYVATSGVLSMLGKTRSPPFPPVNLLADFAGGGLLTAMGICAALIERSKSGRGQVVDTSMTEGAAYVSSFLWRTRCADTSIPIWFAERGGNLLDGGAHFYQTYETSEGKYMAVGALEPQFYAEFVKGLGMTPDEFPQMQDMDEAKEEVSKIFKSKTQSEWIAIFKDTDACVTPVIDFDEVAKNEQHKARGAFVEYGGALAPSPAPHLSRTPGQLSKLSDPKIGEHTLEILNEFGINQSDTDGLIKESVVQVAKAKL